MKISVLGSCVSRVSLLNGEQREHGIANGEELGLELEYFLDKQNMALAMMPSPFTEEEVMSITREELWDKSRLISLRQNLLKETVGLLLNAESEYIVMDLYDFHNCFLSYKDTAFATQAGEFGQTGLFERHRDEMLLQNSFFEMPTWAYYPLVDLFFEKIMQKYDSDHIILNRFRANTFYLAKNGKILTIPDVFKKPIQCNDKYNASCRKLEDYIIQKYNPYVIDISHYFMGDENIWDNLNAAHFEKEFYRETYRQICRIVKKQGAKRYFDTPCLFEMDRPGIEEDSQRELDVEWGLEVLELFLDIKDELSLNLLEKLYIKAPEDERVKRYLKEIAGL